jgi:hypothetical protein
MIVVPFLFLGLIYCMLKSFWEYIQTASFPNERPLIAKLSKMTPVQQVQLDISLHNDAIKKNAFGHQSNQLLFDTQWKKRLIQIFQGAEKNPEIINQTIDIIGKDIDSHRNRSPNEKTGSSDWHNAWIAVYGNWIKQLQSILGALHGSQGKAANGR